MISGKPDPRMTLPYTAEDAKHVLEAARRENEAHVRWVPGSRRSQVPGLMRFVEPMRPTCTSSAGLGVSTSGSTIVRRTGHSKPRDHSERYTCTQRSSPRVFSTCFPRRKMHCFFRASRRIDLAAAPGTTPRQSGRWIARGPYHRSTQDSESFVAPIFQIHLPGWRH